jgi:23S rRNA A2030 N6-methylase RlmJ
MRLDINVDAGASEAGQRLSSAGLVIVNPPYTFEAEIRAAAQHLAPFLGRTVQAPAGISLTGV